MHSCIYKFVISFSVLSHCTVFFLFVFFLSQKLMIDLHQLEFGLEIKQPET